MLAASRQHRRILAKEVDKGEDEELTKPRPQGQRSQMAAESSVGGASAKELTSRPAVGSNLKGALSTAVVGRSVIVLEPQHMPCLLKSLGSVVMQAEVDKLSHHFYVPDSILMRAPEMVEFPL